jgi:hypothetical protein
MPSIEPAQNGMTIPEESNSYAKQDALLSFNCHTREGIWTPSAPDEKTKEMTLPHRLFLIRVEKKLI